MESHLLRSFPFHANISCGIGTVANLNNGKAWLESGVSLLDFDNLILDLFAKRPVN
jgi:hypothetical protein